MRLFVAIEFDESFRNQLIELQGSLRSSLPVLSFTKPQNLHLTIKFIGELEEKKVPALCEVLSAVARDGSFPLRYIGLDFLPERGPIRIIVAAVDGTEKLLALQNQIEEACATQNIPRENRRFRAHITLARDRRGLPRSKKPSAAQIDGVMNVKQFVLMQSRLSIKGSEYAPLHHVHL
jgi:2'-5' RNA ligase